MSVGIDIESSLRKDMIATPRKWIVTAVYAVQYPRG